MGKNWAWIKEHLTAFADRTRQAGCRVAVAAGLLGLAISATSAARSDDPLRISIAEGHTLNEFYRDGPVAAHLVLRSGDTPRFLVAFPAGNSGVALWFSTETPLNWSPEIEVEGASETLADGAERYGVIAELTAEGGPILVQQAVLSNVRVIRDYEDNGVLPAEVAAEPIVDQTSVVWDRRRLDGGGGYRLAIDVLEGSVPVAPPHPSPLRPVQKARCACALPRSPAIPR